MTKVSVSMEKDLLNRVDQRVEDSHIYETRSQYIRAAIRKSLEEEANEFSEAR